MPVPVLVLVLVLVPVSVALWAYPIPGFAYPFWACVPGHVVGWVFWCHALGRFQPLVFPQGRFVVFLHQETAEYLCQSGFEPHAMTWHRRGLQW